MLGKDRLQGGMFCGHGLDAFSCSGEHAFGFAFCPASEPSNGGQEPIGYGPRRDEAKHLRSLIDAGQVYRAL